MCFLVDRLTPTTPYRRAVIVAFGVVKALSNIASGMLADRFTRKAMLVTGWVIGLPVPFMLAWGP